MSLVSTDIIDGVAVVTADNPPVNALGHALKVELMNVFSRLRDDAPTAAVLIAAGRTFMAGADVREFGQPIQPPAIFDVAALIESLPFPVVAAIHGNALGGGLELALGCHARIAERGTRLGFPEVTLGVIPGSGGVVRTVRLLAPADAVALVTSGERISAERAARLGLIDRVVDGDLREAAMDYARELAFGRRPAPLSERPTPDDPGPDFWAEQETAVRRKARGSQAPLVALDVLRTAYAEPFEAARVVEGKAFERLRDSGEARALRHVFFAERRAAKAAKADGARKVETVGIVGGGTMGAGIATALLQRGLTVTLAETTAEAAKAGRARVEAAVTAAARRGLVKDASAVLAGLATTTDFAAFGPCDLVVEAVFEDLAVKRDVFRRLEGVVSPNAILVTNTSFLDPREIASAVSDRTRFLGLHFFSPAQVMKLVEIVPLPETAEATLATAFALTERLGKVGVRSGICEGFIGNRIYKRYRTGAEDIAREGVPIARIDAAMRGFGLALGPFETQDLTGLDIAFRQREAARAAGEDIPETIGDRLVKAGRLGQKSGGGWYDYAEGDRTPRPSAATAAILAAAGVPREAPGLAEAEIAARLVAGMAEEGAAILAEGVAGDASDIDLVEIHGYGFPRWRGGPMHLAREMGLAKLEAALGRPASDALRQLVEPA
ncbi:3-hydroxyacyl-CoA dehydrogenase NAD-binding domain-containing protein [Jiella sp. M17.18]|uniref:3-hydroxyacyl-CoA dehydrogenase NAD-binding domain-containing protein n=1 Tax=Jiella sp. M17.18 TaxID=3234247 RepID=UPI0034DEE1A5